MKPTTRSFILFLACIVAAVIMLSSIQPSAAFQANSITQPVAVHVFQTTTTNSTSTTTTNATGPLGFITTPIVAWVKGALAPLIGEPPQIPLSTLFTIGVAITLALISSTAAKLLVDYDMVRSTMKEVQSWQKELNAARKANDQQTLSKLQKKQAAMMKQQSRASMEQMKVTAVTFVPFLLIWYLLNAVFGPYTIAYAPFPLPVMGTTLRFFYWYFLCSLAMNFPLMRIFGIGMSDS